MAINSEELSSDVPAEAGRCGLAINRLPFAYLFCDRDFHIREWNSAAEKMLGYTRSEALGRHAPKLLLPGPVPNDVRDVIRRIWTGDADAHSVNKNRTKSGRIILCNWFNTPTYDRDGNINGVIALGQDITNRTLAETMLDATQRIFHESFATAQSAVLLVDDSGLFVDANPVACELWGYSREEMLGTHAENIASGLHAEGHVTPRACGGEFALMCKDGHAHEMEFAYVPNVLPGVRLCVVQPVSEAEVAIALGPSYLTSGSALSGDTHRAARAMSAAGFALASKSGAYAAIFCNKIMSRTGARGPGAEGDSQEPVCRRLTSRQRQVLQLLAEGLKTKQIARELGLSIKTIELHRGQLMKALEIHDIPGLVRFAVRLGIVSPD